MRFFKNGKLEDKKIEEALRKAADDYANGELIEVRDLLLEIINAIDAFDEAEEMAEHTSEKIPVCKMCGQRLGQFIPGIGVICSSSYISGDYCHECQVDHCLDTNCLACEMGQYPNCKHLDLKKYYQNPDE